MDKHIIFIKTLKAMLRLKKAISLGFPLSYVGKLDAQLGEYLDELESQNLMDEFADFVLE